MAKNREIFAELVEGVERLADERLGKITLRRYVVGASPLAQPNLRLGARSAPYNRNG